MAQFTEAIEDYLKAIYMLAEQHGDADGLVGGQRLAHRLGVSHASVTNMLKRLAELGLVRHEARKGVALTDGGRRIALEVVRHHRLIEAYLAEVLGMSWDEVHDEAEILEHHISERVEALMAERLGHPTFDPHGHPIPRTDLTLPEHEDVRSLDQLAVGECAVVKTVRNEQRELLRFLHTIGVVPDRALTVQARGPLGDTLTILNEDGAVHAIGREIAERIDVC